jgi:hypothetical protein
VVAVGSTNGATKVKRADNSLIGYISNIINNLGQYVYTADVVSSLQISFQLPSGASTSSQLNIKALNGNAYSDLPQVGGILGNNDYIFRSGSYEYEYLYIYIDFANNIHTGSRSSVQPISVSIPLPYIVYSLF